MQRVFFFFSILVAKQYAKCYNVEAVKTCLTNYDRKVSNAFPCKNMYGKLKGV